jgi:RimJ/RimL family protein N-acetyltransferase
VSIFTSAITIETERLRLTTLQIGDYEEMADVLGDERLHEFIGGRPLTREELRDRYRALVAGPSDPSEVWLNWTERLLPERTAVGTVQATVTSAGDGRFTADMAWVMGIAWQGRGIGSDAARALVDWLRGRGVENIAACIHPGPPRLGSGCPPPRAPSDG